LAPKSTAHDYFVLLDCSGALQRMYEALYIMAREQAGKEASLTAAIIDSQSVKAAQKGLWTGLDPRGFDAGKKVTASDHVLVDTLALLLSVVFHANAVQDRDGAREVLRQA
jgi:hypothetical protein